MNTKTLIIDPKISGISGDMIISALVDLTEVNNLNKLINSINELDNRIDFKVAINDKLVNGINAKKN